MGNTIKTFYPNLLSINFRIMLRSYRPTIKFEEKLRRQVVMQAG